MSNFQYCFVCMDTLERKKKMEGTVQICISPIESLFCYFHLASRFWRDQYWYFSGKEIGTCALVELLRILNSFWHNLSQRQGITLQGENCYYSVNLMGKKKLNESWKENEWKFLLLPTSQVHKKDGELRIQELKKSTFLWWKLFSSPSSLCQRAMKMPLPLF